MTNKSCQQNPRLLITRPRYLDAAAMWVTIRGYRRGHATDLPFCWQHAHLCVTFHPFSWYCGYVRIEKTASYTDNLVLCAAHVNKQMGDNSALILWNSYLKGALDNTWPEDTWTHNHSIFVGAPLADVWMCLVGCLFSVFTLIVSFDLHTNQN